VTRAITDLVPGLWSNIASSQLACWFFGVAIQSEVLSTYQILLSFSWVYIWQLKS
jgi:hypothetical protein